MTRTHISRKEAQNAIDVLQNLPQDTTLDELLQELISAFDGPRGYANQVRAVYNDAREGSQTKQRILDMIGSLISRKASIDKNVKEDYSQLPDEDLFEAMGAIVKDFRNVANTTDTQSQTGHAAEAVQQSAGETPEHEA